MSAPRIALIGAGQMSYHHARVIVESGNAVVDVVVDTQLERARRLADIAKCRASNSLEEATRCDAVVIATPTETHVDIAMDLLAAGRPVLIEKPIATEPSKVEMVLAESRRRGVPVMCGFVERFNPVLQTAAQLMDSPPIHVLALRHSPPAPRIATSVVYDMLIHDIDIALRYMEALPESVRASVWKPPGSGVLELADCVLTFDGAIATLSANRVSQRKIRSFFVTWPGGLFEIDLLRQDLSLYRHVSHEQVAEGMSTYRAETVIDIPFVRHAGEPLALQFQHFLRLMDGALDADSERATLLAPHQIAAEIEAS